MPVYTCKRCRHRFRVPPDEDDPENPTCPHCNYSPWRDAWDSYTDHDTWHLGDDDEEEGEYFT